MKKGKFALVILFAVLLLAAVIAGVFLWKHYTDYSTTLRANWGISIPEQAGCSEIYRASGRSGAHGDGIRYHMFTYENQEPISELFSWKAVEGSTVSYGTYAEAANHWLTKIAVPLERRPDYARCVSWYQKQEDNSELLIFWNESEKILYVLESFL